MKEEKVFDKAHELARAIIDSDIYQDYLKQAEMIKEFPDLQEKIVLMRRHQLEINQEHLMGRDVAQEKINEVAQEFARLQQDPRAAVFIAAEGRYLQMVGNIQEILQQTLSATMGV